MIVCHGLFIRSSCPKYLEPVCAKMEEANECAFLSICDNFELFTETLEKLLANVRIAGSTAHLNICMSAKEDSGQLSLYAKRDAQDAVARLYFFRIRHFWDFDEDTDSFADVEEVSLPDVGLA